MKFSPEAIDIPIELIQAQQNDNLVLFCGAGISYPAGLPLFDGLVNKVYEELVAEPSNEEKQAIKQWHYDTALELLENRFNSENRLDKHLVRKAIATRLTLKENANIETHQAILELAKTKQHRYRLVTTNVDNGFIVANKDTLKFSDAAPKLPIPKPHTVKSN
jgi:NAD-dependent SIR2 family protein deacetylase